MTVKDDLIRARQLVRTEPMWRLYGSWNALIQAVGEERAFPAYNALEDQVPRTDRHLRYYENEPGVAHSDIVALWDRAIAAST